MTVANGPVPKTQFNQNGIPLSGGKLFTYAAGTTTKLASYTDSTGATPNTNPIILDSNGQCDIFLTPTLLYKYVLSPSNDTDPPTNPFWTEDDVSGMSASSFQSTLSSSSGSSNIGYNQGSTGAATITQKAKNQQILNAADFTSYDPTGATDSTSAIVAAYTALGASGGVINIGNADKVYIASNLTLPPNIHIQGPHLIVGTPGSNSSVPYASMGGSILLSSAATITLGPNSGLSGLLIYRYGMTFPASSSSSFAGTAITGGGDDCFVIGCMILGFAQAFYSSGFQRPRIYNCNMDNLAGIWIDNCTDIPYINKVHCWPFSTIPTGTPASALRSGSAFIFSTVCDWGKVTDCFSYGYAKGFWANGVNDMTFTNCSCDGTQTFSGSIGYAADGGGLRNKFIGGNVSSQDTAVYLGDTDGTYAETEFIGCHFTTCAVHGVNVQSSDATFTACVFDAVPYGIYVNDTASAVQVIGCRFSNISVGPISGISGCSKVRVSPNNDFGAFTGASPVQQGNLGLTVVPSASPLVIPINTHFFQVSGTTGFSSMPYGWAGREVTIVFSGILTVSEGTGSDSLNLASSASFTTDVGATMKFVHNGTNWFELSRKL